ncbi:membrane-associated tyrosine- and threonine-specific cdc2-inhibitory kinase isoform X1 [Carassius auratus]|uniref:non-specific serine/threonine protein kinase n=1 Tax=Carassius auratus TaxID=7957 RepID=A0A6P6L2C3_CARAU|nr:membrane-associated tyrosine- and threonine-specific cdc2-inhibitory kinase isoform X1 [Carassius auratus]XP_026078710.1 membrane-associated tyrosine- and threonine-specific cdc2-inhibitory kinase isoform X1 [Carassius auratus]XP_026078711.1 membrane-associated tyrosine- and threonine-specific cdc2-inhibitory kinase isoform X1 [Carassius auratus]
MSAPHQTSVVSTPLPLPTHFSHAQQSFSLKKRRCPFSSSSSSSLSPPRSLCHSLPPRPPSKGCPPLSRVFHHRPTPWTPLSRSLIESPPPRSVYNPSRPQTFFDQCFTNLGLIGRGSFGEVFKVVCLLDGCQYAVKRSVQRFRGEVERARSIAEAWNHEGLHPHPYVLGFIAAWEEAGHLYIQTELCCTSLLLYAEESPFHTGETSAWMYLCDMLSALDHLHAHGFAHLDIKPANIFITKSGRLKLGDFGLLIKLPTDVRKQVREGKREMETEKVDLQEGDPRYMAPELLRGEYGTAADIFSLGVSILELACNIEVPKGGDDWQQLRMGHLPAEFTYALSEDMQYLLRLMLNPEACKRATTQQLLSLPSVCKRKWRRQLSLYFTESFLSLFHWCQSLLTASWNFISSLNLLFTSVYETSSTCTPPRERWERDADMSNIYYDSESPIPEFVLPPDDPEHSPTFTHSVQEHVSVGSTSTPLPDTHINDTRTSSHRKYTHSPSRISSSSSLSPIHHSSQHSITDSPCSRERSWITAELSVKSNFEPKNLLSLFDEAT